MALSQKRQQKQRSSSGKQGENVLKVPDLSTASNACPPGGRIREAISRLAARAVSSIRKRKASKSLMARIAKLGFGATRRPSLSVKSSQSNGNRYTFNDKGAPLELVRPPCVASSSSEYNDFSWHFDVFYQLLRQAEVRPSLHAAPSLAMPAELQRSCVRKQTASRSQVVEWMCRCHQYFDLSTATLFLSIRLLDRLFMQWHMPEATRLTRKLAVLGSSVLLIASKFEDECPPDAEHLSKFSAGLFTVEELIPMETRVLARLDYCLHIPTAYHHLHWFSKLNGGAANVSWWLTQYLAEIGLHYQSSASWTPSQHAAAAVVCTNKILGRPLMGPNLRAAFTAGCPPRHEDCWLRGVQHMTEMLLSDLQTMRRGVATYDKFAAKCRGSIARIVADQISCRNCP